jgi:hypothetical protein
MISWEETKLMGLAVLSGPPREKFFVYSSEHSVGMYETDEGS